MRNYSSGTIQAYRTKAGERYRVALPRLATGGARKWKTFATREQAEAALGLAAAAMTGGEAVHDAALKLGQYAERYLDSAKHRTVADDRSRWSRHVAKRPIAALALASVQPGHIKRTIEGMQRTRKLVPVAGKRGDRATSKELVSAQTVRHVYGLLRRIFAEAIVDGHIRTNPCDGYRIANVERQRVSEPATHLSPEEIELVLAGPLELKYRLIYEVAIFTGMREGELWGLRWADLDLDGARPHCTVRHNYDGPTKGSKIRPFTLLPRAAAALRRWRDLAKRTKPSDLVFPGPCGRMHTKGYDAGWSKHRALCGIREGVTFHAFRHTCASHLVMGTWGPRWPLHDVSKYLGHSSIGVTQRYAHLSTGHLADLAAQTTGLNGSSADHE